MYALDNSLKIFYNGTESAVNIFRRRTYELLNVLPKEKKVQSLKQVFSPMPGKVTKVLVREKQKIFAGDNLIILDAMKMENLIKSEFSGIIKKVLVKENQSVSSDELLITFD